MHPHDTVTPTPEHDEPNRPELPRAIGAVLGAAVGDALGAPFEFMPRGAYRTRFAEPVLEGPGEMVGGGTFGWAPGEFTDDTQMGVALAESLLEHGRYEPDAVWARWRTWAATARDIGINTRRSLSSSDWRDVAGDSSRSAGNGALMRSFPLAVAMFESTDAAVLDVCLHQAALTHGHPAAGWGSWIGVELMRFAIAGTTSGPSSTACSSTCPTTSTQRSQRCCPPPGRPTCRHRRTARCGGAWPRQCGRCAAPRRSRTLWWPP